jgi:predicted PurR-regulated permease PerM
MNTVVIVCLIVVTLAILLTVAFMIGTLVQVRKVSREAETLLKSINKEVNTVVHLTDTVSGMVDRFSSPWVKAGSWATAFISALMRSRRKDRAGERCDEEEAATARR